MSKMFDEWWDSVPDYKSGYIDARTGFNEGVDREQARILAILDRVAEEWWGSDGEIAIQALRDEITR